ncbi:Autophagy-related protein 27 [Nakaseomyces glabratus]|nr:Autophagy-related protein 27 [Nakaseomyces glabratus]KTB25881.1 Autophagy-related protein 27 [Nakaseomyces glabratus]QNG17201.1 uncharacterized protein GWK60_M11275 [Nakaseomyces glabratus]SCV14572.1 Autophagy-related protein 27 [Nakaseomyces glabratus]SLM13302.1 Autophagy-related protein 27 [Nakaseomyces glabratus]
MVMLGQVVALAMASSAVALNCKNHNVLSNYNVANKDILLKNELDTPPSKTSEMWYLAPCEDGSRRQRPSECSSDDLMCAIRHVKVDGSDHLTQKLDVHKSAKYEVEEVESGGFDIRFLGVKWGSNTIDATLSYSCDTNLKTDELVTTIWNSEYVLIEMSGPSGCKRDGNSDSGDNGNGNGNGNGNDPDNNNNTGKDKKSKKTSWFTWLFVYAILFTVIYLMVVSYLNTKGGSFQDFRNEFVERGTEFITSLPTFVKEVVTKTLGTRDSSASRGGYSAV